MKNIKTFDEYVNEKKEEKKKKVVEPVKPVVATVVKPEEVVEEKPKPKGLTPKQEKNLPEPLKAAILKAQNESK